MKSSMTLQMETLLKSSKQLEQVNEHDTKFLKELKKLT